MSGVTIATTLTSQQQRGAFAERQENRTALNITAFGMHAMFVRSPNDKPQKGASESGPAGQGDAQETRVMRSTIDTREPPASYPFRYPLSFYGPYGESLPRISSPAWLNAAVARAENSNNGSAHNLSTSMNHTASRMTADLFASSTTASNLGSSVTLYPPSTSDRETRSLYELCAASMKPDVRQFASEWESASRIEPSNLSRMSAKMKRLDAIATAFAAHVQPIAAKIIEELGEPNSHRTIRSLPSVDHVYIMHGLVFTLVQNTYSSWLYGSFDGAGRAASNELRAVRTLLGNPVARAHPPLCAAVLHMGQVMFVSAPLPIAKNPHESLLYGGMNHQYVAVDPLGTYCSSQLAEFVPLAKHASPDPAGNVALWTPTVTKFFAGTDASTVWIADCAHTLPHAVVPYDELSKTKNKDDGLGSRGLSRHPVEDEINARLSNLFRPEFLHNNCVVQLNPEAGAPHLPPSSLENTAHCVHHIHTQNCWALVSELLSLEHSKQLVQNDIAAVFHRQGVNLRYMGRVYNDIDSMMTKHQDLRDAVKNKLALEAASRTLKSILSNALASETTRRGSDATNVTIQLFRQFLLCVPGAIGFFWNNGPMKETMTKKFGFYVCPAVEPTTSSDGQDVSDGVPKDGALRIYRTLYSGKRRVERPPPSLQWADNGAGSVVLHEDGVKQLNIAGDDGLNVVFPLLGNGAKQNSALMQVAMLRCRLDISSDLRGKRLVVTFKPFTKSCTALIVSESIQAVYEHGPSSLTQVLEKDIDDPAMCDLVEPSAKKELQAMSRIADSDPRATLPLQVLAHCNIARGNLQQAYAIVNRWLYLKRNSPVDCVVGYSLIDIGSLYFKTQRPDKAETILVEGLGLVRNSTLGVNLASFADTLVAVGTLVSTMAWEGNTRPPADRILRVLEYLYYATNLAETDKLVSIWKPLTALAELRKRIMETTPCWSCSRPATVMITSDVDASEKPPAEKDIISQNSKTLSAGAMQQHHSLLNQRRQTTTMQRRRRDDTKKNEDEDVEVFVKRSLEKIDTLYLDLPSGTSPIRVTSTEAAKPAGANLLAATASTIVTASNATVNSNSSMPALDPSDLLPICQTLQDLHRPVFMLARPNRYFCNECVAKRLVANPSFAPERQPIGNDLITLYGRLTKTLLAVNQQIRSADTPALGESLLAFGNLQKDIETVCAAVQELTLVFGPVTHAVLRAKLDLVDVLQARSLTTVEYTGTTRDMAILIRAEDVLREMLTCLLESDETRTEFAVEIATVVRKLQEIAAIYSEFPVAKREHQALHYIADELVMALGPTHSLVGSAYAKLKAYYTNLSKKRNDRFAGATALMSAGKYACSWLECRGAHPDATLELESQLTDIADNIVKPLRAGTSNERHAAMELYAQVRRIISGSLYNNDETVAAKLNDMGELFRSHLKVMERTDAVRALREEVAAAMTMLHQAAHRVKLHRKRTDQYGLHIVAEMLDIRNDILKKTKKTLDPELQDDVAALCELYAQLTKTPKNQISDSANLSDDDSGGEAGQAPSPTNDPSANQANTTTSNANSGAAGDTAGLTSGPKVVKAYISPYQCLGPAPAIAESLLSNATASTPNVRRRRGEASSGGKSHTTSTSRSSLSWGGPGKALPVTPAQQTYLSTLASSKNPETIEHVAKLLPKIAKSLESKNFNPVRE